MLKRPRNFKDEKDNLNKDIMRKLIITDPSMNQRDFQSENNADPVIDEFYEKTMMKFNKEAPLTKKIKGYDKLAEKNSLQSLESLVHEIIHEKKKKKDFNNNNDEITQKYEEYKQKSANILKLISKTSKIIFNEKNKSFSDKKKSFIKTQHNKDDSKFTIIKESRRKALTLDQTSSYLTEYPNKNSENSNLPPNSRSQKNTKSRFSVFFEKFNPDPIINKNFEMKARKHAKTVSFHVQSPNSQFLPLPSLEQNTTKVQRFTNKKTIMAKLDQIMNQTEDVKEMYRNEKETINKIQNEAHSFFQGQKIKLKPQLESLMMTFEPIKLKNYHRSTKSMIRDKLRKGKQKQVLVGKDEEF